MWWLKYIFAKYNRFMQYSGKFSATQNAIYERKDQVNTYVIQITEIWLGSLIQKKL